MATERLAAEQETSNWPARLLVGGVILAAVGVIFKVDELAVIGVIAAGAGGAAKIWGRRGKNQ